MTAHIAIGWEDTYHAGLAPSHTMWLYENSRPAWILKPLDPPPSGKEGEQPQWATEPVTWVPSRPEQILADGILLLACRVLRDELVGDMAEELLPDLLFSDWVDLEKLDDDRLATLRENCEEIELDYKLVITVLGGSSLESQLPVLERYPMNVEVCTVTYSRLQSAVGPRGPDPRIADRELGLRRPDARPLPRDQLPDQPAGGARRGGGGRRHAQSDPDQWTDPESGD